MYGFRSQSKEVSLTIWSRPWPLTISYRHCTLEWLTKWWRRLAQITWCRSVPSFLQSLNPFCSQWRVRRVGADFPFPLFFLPKILTRSHYALAIYRCPQTPCQIRPGELQSCQSCLAPTHIPSPSQHRVRNSRQRCLIPLYDVLHRASVHMDSPWHVVDHQQTLPV